MSRHVELAAGRWFELSICEQMANIGSEVHRAILARRAGRLDRFEHAFERALELFDLTLDDPRWRFPRKKEVARAREVFCDRLVGDDEHRTDLESLDRYFLQFAAAARAARAGAQAQM